MTDLQQTLEQYTKQMKDLATIRPQQFDILRVATMITAIPERKWNAAQAVVNNTLLKKDAERTLKTVRATKLLLVNNSENKKNLTNAADRAAWVDNQPDVLDAEIKLFDAETELLASKLAFDCLDDLYNAGKKIMDFLVEQEKATKQYNRYVDEGRKAR
jgi:hypothetical protein